MFCLVYERTGSLYPVIALHALNNAIAFGVTIEDARRVARAGAADAARMHARAASTAAGHGIVSAI